VIYIIDAPEVDRVKIGYTGGAIRTRLSSLQSQSPVILTMRYTLPGSRAREKYMHRLLAPHRLHGEWFTNGPHVADAIDHVVEKWGVHADSRVPPPVFSSSDVATFDATDCVLCSAKAGTPCVTSATHRKGPGGIERKPHAVRTRMAAQPTPADIAAVAAYLTGASARDAGSEVPNVE